MLFLWNQLKKRTFVVPKARKRGKSEKTIVLKKAEYVDMLRSMFKLMVQGIKGNRIKRLRKLQKKASREQVYYYLKEHLYDELEYRLPLWLPLTLAEKLDMLMHQRIDEEMEIMIFLIQQEYELDSSWQDVLKVDVMIERALDRQIYKKYMNLTRYQAFRYSKRQCKQRLKILEEEEKGLGEYINYLRRAHVEYESNLT